MQVEAQDLHTTKQIFVKLIDEALQEFKRSINELEDGEATDVHTNHLLLQLKALLGPVLVDALTILDEQYIQLYVYEGSEIAELQIKQPQQYKHSIWLFPHINHCTCKYFKEFVLGLKEQIHATGSTATEEHVNCSRYTCAHVLALRLAQVLQPTPTTFKVETVTKLQFKNLQDRMYGSYLDLFSESLD